MTPAAEARAQEAEAALADAERALTQALGMIVEFGDLNGFRNLSDQELGASVYAMAIAASECLDRIRAALAKPQAPKSGEGG